MKNKIKILVKTLNELGGCAYYYPRLNKMRINGGLLEAASVTELNRCIQAQKDWLEYVKAKRKFYGLK